MNNDLLTKLIAGYSEPVLICDIDGVILEMNPKAIHFYGTLTGKSMNSLIRQDSGLSFSAMWARVSAGQTLFEQPIETLLHDGTRLMTHATFTPIQHNGEKDLVVCTLKDAVDFRRLFSQLLQAEKLASLGRLGGGIAHLLNTPLGSILLTAQMLGDTLEQEEQLRDIDQIVRQVAICKDIINNFLQLSKPGEAEIHSEIGVNDFVSTVLDLFEQGLSRNSTSIVRDLSAQPCFVLGNQAQLNQLLINLLGNALDAMPRGGDITVHTSCASGAVQIKVSDAGTGVPESCQNDIFDPFFTTKPVGQGTGLGLYISHRIAQDHGGSLELLSTGPNGSTFLITLPLITHATAPQRSDAPEGVLHAATRTRR